MTVGLASVTHLRGNVNLMGLSRPSVNIISSPKMSVHLAWSPFGSYTLLGFLQILKEENLQRSV